MPRLLPYGLAAALLLAACDSTVDPPTEDATAPLRVLRDSAAFGSVTSPTTSEPFGAALWSDGSIRMSGEPDATFSGFLAGLWLGGQQSGETRANVAWYGTSPGSDAIYGNYTTACGTDTDGLFALDADTTYTDTEAWPRAAGAPTNADGSPRVYGDRMLWASFCPTPVASVPEFTSPFQGLRINTAVFAYDREDTKDVRFIRYEIANTGTQPVSNLRVGYFSDTDTPPNPYEAVGYDAESGLSYTYDVYRLDDGSYQETASAGFAFLKTPSDAPVLAHRIMRKNFDPLFWENGAGVEQILFALDGLDNEGNPMIDPTTGAPSRFAFTGDPFAGEATPGSGTGWLDCHSYESDGETIRTCGGYDIRHMTSTGPITLALGETTVVTVFVQTATQETPEASYERLLQTLAAVRAEPSLWQFSPES